MNNKISEKIRNGYNLDLGKLIEDCFEIYKKIFLIAGLGYLLISIFFAALYFFILIIAFGASNMAQWAIELQETRTSAIYIISISIISIIVSAIVAPINAGFLKLCLQAKNKQQLQINTLFEYFKSKYIKDIILGSIVVTLTTLIFNLFLERMGLVLLVYIVHYIATVFFILFLPLVIFSEQNFSDALKNSVLLVAKKPLPIFLAILIAVIGMFVGLIAICIGIFFTLPIINAMAFSIYDNIVGVEEYNVLDEIGQVEGE
ncbi:conserved membrane hypothetical protein [Flavobacterium sp. 9AF]|uniref:hypothetical protein n=1 Tax=Flavobacterium sp. 9AF TaxID=2653142 RepID=UPI0012EFF54C|nr:hypothetical protein [Flavobacterium sp. 9AF]VXB69158.1 conserved membrane hypothetical protein [Flavobacterium sp. 9AF]